MESDSRAEAAQALATITATRASLADRLVTPWWYHPAIGLLLGGLVASQAIDSVALRNLVLVPYFAGVFALMSAYRKRTGLWVNGMLVGAGRRYVIALAVILGVLFVISVLGGVGAGKDWIPLAAGATCVPVVVYLGRRFDRALRADLRGRS